MKKKRLTLQVCDKLFTDCKGLPPENFTAKYVVAGDWRCKITNSGFIICTALRKCDNGVHKMKAKIFLDGQVDIFLQYPLWNGKYKSKHFKKNFEIIGSNLTIVLDNFGEITSRQVEIFS